VDVLCKSDPLLFRAAIQVTKTCTTLTRGYQYHPVRAYQTIKAMALDPT